MKILITTFGTRGDIQPFIALALGLQAAQYEVALCTSEGFRSDIESQHIPYLSMNNELLELSQRILDEKAGGLGNKIATARKMGPAVRRTMDDEWHAAKAFQPDLIIYHPKCLGSYHIAEKLGIPAIMSIPLPFYTPTEAFAVPFVSRNLGPLLNRLTFQLITASNAAYGGSVNDFRKNTLSLPPISRFADLLKRSNGEPVPILYPISPHVVPVPPDYPDHAHLTGYWFLDNEANWQPDPSLVAFLEASPTPIYIGFGSMSAANTKKRTQHIIDAVEATGQRAILASGWSDLEGYTLPDSIYVVKSVPHSWLFPQVAAVVHHGGAGTTAAGLRAGKPSIICPFVGDQPFWAKRIYDLGVGPKAIPQSKITAQNLAEAITTTLNDKLMQQRAAELGQRIRQEDGIARAVQVIEVILKEQAMPQL